MYSRFRCVDAAGALLNRIMAESHSTAQLTESYYRLVYTQRSLELRGGFLSSSTSDPLEQSAEMGSDTVHQ